MGQGEAWVEGEKIPPDRLKDIFRHPPEVPPVFERIHKSYVVRLSAVKALHAHEGSLYEAELRNGLRLPVGRTRYKELREKLA